MSRRFQAMVVALALALPPVGAAALPSTFAPVIGSALLCRSQLDNHYFYAYLQAAFGPAYKHEGGAWWFRAPDARLWGMAVSELMVSDDTSPLVFVGAVAEGAPDKLAQAIEGAVGVRHQAGDASRYPLRTSRPGSTIAYFNDKSKIYCARFKPLPPGP